MFLNDQTQKHLFYSQQKDQIKALNGDNFAISAADQ